MFVGLLLHNQTLPWSMINQEIDKLKFRGDPCFDQDKKIELKFFDKNIGRGLLSSNLDFVDTFEVKIIDPTSDSLNQLEETLPKLTCNPKDFKLLLPFQGHEQRPEPQRLDYKPLAFLKALRRAMMDMGPTLNSIALDFSSWNLAMDDVKNEFIEELTSYVFPLISDSLEQLKLCLFQLGLNNHVISGACITMICKSLKRFSKSLRTLNLDLGRWGCTRHDTLGVIDDDHVERICKLLNKFTVLEYLVLNLRSWGYSNNKITGQSMVFLSQTLPSIHTLKLLNLNLFMWGYHNRSMKTEDLIPLFEAFQAPNFPNLMTLILIMKGFQFCQVQIIDMLFENLKTLPNFIDLSLDIVSWQDSEHKANAGKLINCPRLLKFKEINDMYICRNISKYYETRKKLRIRHNLVYSIHLMHNARLDLDEQLPEANESDECGNGISKPRFTKTLSIFSIFRREAIDEMITTFLI